MNPKTCRFALKAAALLPAFLLAACAAQSQRSASLQRINHHESLTVCDSGPPQRACTRRPRDEVETDLKDWLGMEDPVDYEDG